MRQTIIAVTKLIVTLKSWPWVSVCVLLIAALVRQQMKLEESQTENTALLKKVSAGQDSVIKYQKDLMYSKDKEIGWLRDERQLDRDERNTP
jgi:hypothetical protein